MMHYVYPDTAIEYEPREAIPAEAFLNLIREKNKTYIEFIPEDGIFMGKQVRLEKITAATLKDRALHYVYPGTNKKYEYIEKIPAEAFLNSISEKNKTYIEFIPEDGIFMGKQVRLEQITANALKKRALHYVYPGTNRE